MFLSAELGAGQILGWDEEESQRILKYLWEDRPVLVDVTPASLLGPGALQAACGCCSHYSTPNEGDASTIGMDEGVVIFKMLLLWSE